MDPTFIPAILAVAAGSWFLYYGAERVVEESVAFALKHGVHAGIVGATVVALGTSLPEWVVSMMAVVDGHDAMALGNIVGSNLVNMGLLLGIALVAGKAPLSKDCINRDIPFVTAGMALLALALQVLGELTLTVALLLLGMMALYLWQTVKAAKKSKEVVDSPPPFHGYKLVLGFLLLIGGSQALIFGATELARQFSVPEWLIAVSLVALGTSLPELATTLMSIRKKHIELGIGNMIGSNIWNTLFIGGSVGLFGQISHEDIRTLDLWTSAAMGMVLLLFSRVLKTHTWKRVAIILFVLYSVSVIGWIL